MELDASAIFQEILEIASLPATNSHFAWSGEFNIDGKRVAILKVLSVFTERMYVESYSDTILVELTIGLGTYTHQIYPFKNNLKFTLWRKDMLPNSESFNRDAPILTRTYNCTLAESTSPSMSSGTTATGDQETGDYSNIQTITLQLRDAALDDARTRELSGIFRDVTMTEMLTVGMSNNRAVDTPPALKITPSIWDNGDFSGLAGVDVVPGSNDTRYSHVIVPIGVRLTDLPTFLQEQYGVYNTAIGYYLQRGMWYVYPRYDYTRYSSDQNCLTIANIPANRMAGADKTYKVKGKQLYVLATGNVAHADSSDHSQLNAGNGFRLQRSANVIDSYAKTSKNRTQVSRSANVIEEVVEHHKSKAEHAYFSDRIVSDNAYLERSKLAGRVGGLIQLEWENAEADLIYPGMPTKLLYLKQDKVIEVEAIVHAVSVHSKQIHAGIANDRHISTAAITLFIKRESI